MSSIRKKKFQKMELPQNLLQTFACVASEKNQKLSTKNRVATKFIANFCLCSRRKKTFSQKWSCHKIYCKCKIFLTCVYMIFKHSKRFRFAPSFNYKLVTIKLSAFISTNFYTKIFWTYQSVR
jgi:hypothetical protein